MGSEVQTSSTTSKGGLSWDTLSKYGPDLENWKDGKIYSCFAGGYSLAGRFAKWSGASNLWYNTIQPKLDLKTGAKVSLGAVVVMSVVYLLNEARKGTPANNGPQPANPEAASGTVTREINGSEGKEGGKKTKLPGEGKDEEPTAPLAGAGSSTPPRTSISSSVSSSSSPPPRLAEPRGRIVEGGEDGGSEEEEAVEGERRTSKKEQMAVQALTLHVTHEVLKTVTETMTVNERTLTERLNAQNAASAKASQKHLEAAKKLLQQETALISRLEQGLADASEAQAQASARAAEQETRLNERMREVEISTNRNVALQTDTVREQLAARLEDIAIKAAQAATKQLVQRLTQVEEQLTETRRELADSTSQQREDIATFTRNLGELPNRFAPLAGHEQLSDRVNALPTKEHVQEGVTKLIGRMDEQEANLPRRFAPLDGHPELVDKVAGLPTEKELSKNFRKVGQRLEAAENAIQDLMAKRPPAPPQPGHQRHNSHPNLLQGPAAQPGANPQVAEVVNGNGNGNDGGGAGGGQDPNPDANPAQ